MKLSVREAKLWLLAAAIACVQSNHISGDAWCLEALAALSKPSAIRRAIIRNNEEAVDHNRRFGTPESKRDARILCFCAAVLRAVENAR